MVIYIKCFGKIFKLKTKFMRFGIQDITDK